VEGIGGVVMGQTLDAVTRRVMVRTSPDTPGALGALIVRAGPCVTRHVMVRAGLPNGTAPPHTELPRPAGRGWRRSL
jgi:hypothetical protein